MLPDDDSYRGVKNFRAKEIMLAIVLGAVAASSITCYLLFLGDLGPVALGALIGMEVVIMVVIYAILLKQLRKSGR